MFGRIFAVPILGVAVVSVALILSGQAITRISCADQMVDGGQYTTAKHNLKNAFYEFESDRRGAIVLEHNDDDVKYKRNIGGVHLTSMSNFCFVYTKVAVDESN